MSKEYTTVFFHEKESSNDNDLRLVLNKWAEEGHVLHSIVPYLYEGTTTGYTIVFELDVNNK